MFDFEKLDVYQETKSLNKEVLSFIFESQEENFITDKWKNATVNMMLNLADGTSRFMANEKKQSYAKCRSSVFECVSLMHSLVDLGLLSEEKFEQFYTSYEKISKMMLGLYRNVA
jgi:four helix bundle protein